MSALLDQFIEESRDLIEAAGGALLTLERNPADQRAVNELFRSVHTLKGSSALFDFPALTKLVHAGEDLLDGVRAGTIPVSADLVDLQLELLDLLRTWIDAVRQSEQLPDDATRVSSDLIARLTAAKRSTAGGPAETVAELDTVAPADTCGWLETLPESERIAAFRLAVEDRVTLAAIEYNPDSDCYFRAEDPLLTCRGIPDLLSLSAAGVEPQTPLAEFDPYQCRLRFRALTTAPRAELDHLFRYVADQVQIIDVPPEHLAVPTGAAGSDAELRAFADACPNWILDGQLRQLRENADELLASADPGSRAASALRWLVTLIEHVPDQSAWLLRIARAVGGGECDWNAPELSNAGATTVEGGDLVVRLVAEQRRILAIPTQDAQTLAGRIASVGRTLANIAAAHGASTVVRTIESATQAALDAGDAQALSELAATLFATTPASGSAAAGVGPAGANKSDSPAPEAARETRHIRTLKVDQAKVDRLMALIGELVVAKNALPFLARRAENVHGSRELGREIGQRYSVIDRLAQEMQEAIMQVRLLPVSEVFQRFPRLIRDVTRKLNKQIELVLEGEETQADKNIIELLGDPLIHIVRNSADHGIELPEARIAAGKPAQGTIRLRAMQEGDRVVIEVSDDGRGVDTQRVIAKALERGLIDPEEADRMTPAEAANLIFHPGLSTADTVSDLSGRGVGMDVVQTAIRDAGGSVAVTSQPGIGTTVRLALPLSMAVMRVMTIETAGALYGVPIELIAETVRIDATAIRQIKQSEAFMLRDTIVPLVRMRSLLRLPARHEEREAVLVLRLPTGLVGVIVDRFDEHMDIILKPLEGILVGLKGFAGTALLGDGRVLMILDVKELL